MRASDAHFGADGALGQAGLAAPARPARAGRGKIQHGEDGAHALWESPEAADLAEAFGEVLFELGSEAVVIVIFRTFSNY